MRRMLMAITVFLIFSVNGLTATNVDSIDKYSWSADFGWVNWQGDVVDGADFTGAYVLGYIYSPNVGWINLGNGPQNGSQYANASGADSGVNVDASSDPGSYLLSGYAYGANIGWISFNTSAQAGPGNQPRIDKTTGMLQGYAWGANVGWILLGDSGASVVKVNMSNPAHHWEQYD